MGDIKNKVLIFDDKGKQIGEVKDDGSIKKFGIFQEIYSKEEGIDPTTGAKNLLKVKPAQAIKISAIGDINCLSCYFVEVKDTATGLSGKYWISSDSHTFENGTHKMELELKFDSLMDTKDIKEESEKKEEKKKTEKESKGKAKSSSGTPEKKKSKQKEVLESVKKAVKEQQAPAVSKPARPERKKYTGMME